jgi:DNA-directed RNA polymerase subunit omega
LATLVLRLLRQSIAYPAQFLFTGKSLNAELTKKALEKVGNPNVLVNLISRRVRQLNSGAGALSRPLVADTGNLGAADIALLEIIEDKVGFEMPEVTELTRPVGKKRKKH